MSEAEKRKTVDELDAALQLLDHELAGLRLAEPLKIRAIGGYALLKHGVRTGARAYTVDIDTVTESYSAAVENAIRKVAAQADLEPGWLNNDNVLGDDVEQIESMLEAEWIPQATGLRNIAVSIASIETLTRAKIMASEDAAISNRFRDVADLEELLDFQGIARMREFDAKYPDPFEEYPEARQLVQRHLSPAGSIAARAPKASAIARFPELAELDTDDDFDGYDDLSDLELAPGDW